MSSKIKRIALHSILLLLTGLSLSHPAQDIHENLLYQLEKIDLAYDSITASIVDDDDQLWIGSHKGLWVISGDQLLEYSFKHGLFNKEINDIYYSDQKQIWIATSKGPFAFINNHFYVFEPLKDINTLTISENADSWFFSYR